VEGDAAVITWSAAATVDGSCGRDLALGDRGSRSLVPNDRGSRALWAQCAAAHAEIRGLRPTTTMNPASPQIGVATSQRSSDLIALQVSRIDLARRLHGLFDDDRRAVGLLAYGAERLR
jgi:hypothetical protein